MSEVFIVMRLTITTDNLPYIPILDNPFSVRELDEATNDLNKNK